MFRSLIVAPLASGMVCPFVFYSSVPKSALVSKGVLVVDLLILYNKPLITLDKLSTRKIQFTEGS